VVAWCTGPRCTALHRLADGEDHAKDIASTVRATRGAVLITSPCLGRCELACVAAVAGRDGPSRQIGPLAWFTGLENSDRFQALQTWVLKGGPQQILRPDRILPAALRAAACGVTPPPRFHRH
jgi:(2Fe-2S) ferredoxin